MLVFGRVEQEECVSICVGGGGKYFIVEEKEGEVALKEGKGGAPTAHSHTLWQSSPIQWRAALKYVLCTMEPTSATALDVM